MAPDQLPPPGPPPHDRAEAVRRILKHLRRSAIADLEEGSAAVVLGTARAIPGRAPLHSPVTGRDCLGYHLDVRLVELDERWLFPAVYEDARCGDFDVVDATGTVRVLGAGLELAITDGIGERWTGVPMPLRPFVRVDHSTKPVTLEEGLLVDGDTVLVCGIVAREPTATDYRDGAPLLAIKAAPRFPLVASTDRDLLVPGDRPIAPEELARR